MSTPEQFRGNEKPEITERTEQLTSRLQPKPLASFASTIHLKLKKKNIVVLQG